MKKVRERIIDTAHALFYSQGYHNTGINQVIEEAQVAKASLYQHFPSKEELCLAYLDYRSANWFRNLLAHTETGTTPTERLSLLYDFVLEFVTADSFRGCAFQNISSEVRPVEDARVQEEVKRIKSKLRRFFQQFAARDPAAVSAEEQLLGDQLAVLFEGSMIAYKMHREIWPVEAARTASLALLPV